LTVNKKQVIKLMKESQKGSLKKASMLSGLSEKTARKYLRDKRLPVVSPEPRKYQTRSNPFENHWCEITSMLERSSELQAQTLMTYLLEQYPDCYKPGHIRSLQRHLKIWRAENGLGKPVIFRQTLKPGQQSQSDWPHMNALNITINGDRFPHLLFHFLLPYSGFETVMICESESFETLTQGFERGVLEAGGVALSHRTDNLTAATQAMGNGRIFTKRWLDFLDHYKVEPSRNNPGVSHENGSIEKSHHLFKNAVDQHVMVRQSRDFKTLQDYENFLDKIKAKRNFARREKIREELGFLRNLPEKQFNEATFLTVRVNPFSTIQVLGVTYSVPSRLIGFLLKTIVWRESLDLIYGGKKLLTLPRLEAGILIDYRHIIDSLIRKPGAFESYQYRSSLYPNVVFRKAYDVLKDSGLTSCNKKYLDLLHLEKMYGESDVTTALDLLLESSSLPLKEDILELLKQEKTRPPVEVRQPKLEDYDQLYRTIEVAS
jgi:hypothetical protein